MNNEEKLRRIELEKERVEKEIADHEKTLPDLIEFIFKTLSKFDGALVEIEMIETMGKDDLEWLADDIIDHGSALAAAIRKLSQCQ